MFGKSSSVVLLLLHLFCYLHLIHHSLNLNLHSHAYSGPVVHFTGQYIISSSYKEGGSPFSVSSNLTSSNQTLLDSYGKHTPLREVYCSSTQVIQYGLVFLMIASGVLFYYLRRKMRLNKSLSRKFTTTYFISIMNWKPFHLLERYSHKLKNGLISNCINYLVII